MQYQEFIENKKIVFTHKGKTITDESIHPMLFPFQRDIVRWACSKGRAAIFADTGLGKTFMQLEWGRLMGENTLVIAPLSVARQTVREAVKLGIELRYVRSQSDVTTDHRMWITNYEMISHFDASEFGSVILDESSILKSLDGVTRRTLTEMFAHTPYRLACTATPAPNDRTEIGNHTEFLGIASMTDMLSMFFVHANKEEISRIDGIKLRRKLSNSNGQEWRLKHHAEESFYRWMSSWAMSIRKPSDLGYSDDGYKLPPLSIIPHYMEYDFVPDGQLVFTGIDGIQGLRAIRRETTDLRCESAAEIANSNDEQWIVWVGLNTESSLMAELIPDSIEVVGSDSPEQKANAIEAFQDGKFRVLVTKPSIAGFGMNFQNAHNQIFVGLSYSWEEWYQAIRRSYRFLQDRPVEIYAALTPQMQEVWDTIQAKEKVAAHMSEQLISHVRKFEIEQLHDGTNEKKAYQASKAMRLPKWLKQAA